MKENEYALYKGDKFIDLGTLNYLSNKYHMTKQRLICLACPSTHKKSHGNMLLVYKIK